MPPRMLRDMTKMRNSENHNVSDPPLLPNRSTRSYASLRPLHPYVEDNPIHSIGITAAKIRSQHRLLLGLQLGGSLVKRIAVRVCSGTRSAIGYGGFILEKPMSAAARARRAAGIGS